MTTTVDLRTMRFRGVRRGSGERSDWVGFIHEVNRIRPGTFGRPIHAKHWTGVHSVEKYPAAHVIYSTSDDEEVRQDEGVRIVLLDDTLLPVWEQAARATGYIT